MAEQQFERDIVSLFENSRLIVDGERAQAEAKMVSDAQPGEYSKLFGVLTRTETPTGRFSYNVGHLVRYVNEVFNEHAPSISRVDGKWFVESPLPILVTGLVDRVIEAYRNFARDWSDAQLKEHAGILCGAIGYHVVMGMEGTEAQDFPEALRLGMAQYVSAKEKLRKQDEATNEINFRTQTLAKAQRELAVRFTSDRQAYEEQSEHFRAEAAAITATLDQHKAMAVEIAGRIEEARESMTSRLSHQEAELGEAISRFDETVQQRLDLIGVQLLWSQRAEQSRRALVYSIAAFVAVGLIGILTVIICGQTILDFVNPLTWKTLVLANSVGGAIGAQIGRVLLVSIPVVVYFWGLKLLMRLIIRSLLLMDDARQRETIMRTYFLIAKEGHADERGLPMMLWALFRQVPGHGPDGIEPPDFTEAINAGMGRFVASGK